MITNEKQYRSARAAVDRIGVELASLKDAKDGVHPVLRRAQIAGLQSQVSELDEEVREYEHLQTGAVTSFEAEGLADLPEILIRARIARGMSQRDLGIFVGVAEQQIQRYEAERYRSASLERLSEIAAALDITMRESAQLRTEPPAEDGPESVWSFPVTEMYNRGYFEDFSGSAAQARKQANDLIPIHLTRRSGPSDGVQPLCGGTDPASRPTGQFLVHPAARDRTLGSTRGH